MWWSSQSTSLLSDNDVDGQPVPTWLDRHERAVTFAGWLLLAFALGAALALI